VQLVSKEIWVIGGQLLAGSVSVVGHGCPALSGCKKDSVDTKKSLWQTDNHVSLVETNSVGLNRSKTPRKRRVRLLSIFRFPAMVMQRKTSKAFITGKKKTAPASKNGFRTK
jgi:hypothetical protein